MELEKIFDLLKTKEFKDFLKKEFLTGDNLLRFTKSAIVNEDYNELTYICDSAIDESKVINRLKKLSIEQKLFLVNRYISIKDTWSIYEGGSLQDEIKNIIWDFVDCKIKNLSKDLKEKFFVEFCNQSFSEKGNLKELLDYGKEYKEGIDIFYIFDKINDNGEIDYMIYKIFDENSYAIYGKLINSKNEFISNRSYGKGKFKELRGNGKIANSLKELLNINIKLKENELKVKENELKIIKDFYSKNFVC